MGLRRMLSSLLSKKKQSKAHDFADEEDGSAFDYDHDHEDFQDTSDGALADDNHTDGVPVHRSPVQQGGSGTPRVKGSRFENQLNMKDYKELGLAQMKVSVVLNNFIAAEKQHQGIWTEFEMEGHTLYENKQFADRFDKRVKAYLDQLGAEVTFVVLITQSPMVNRCAMDRDGKCVSANFYAPELDGIQGVAFRAAVMKLAQKYAHRVKRWVYLNEIDDHYVWANSGEKSPDEYCAEYVRGMEILANALRNVAPDAIPYVSLTRNWSRAHRDNPKHCCKPMHIVKYLLRSSIKDLDWGFAFHPYGPKPWERLDDPKFFKFDTPLIDMANIEIINSILAAPEARIGGRPRKYIFSEQGYQSGNEDSGQRRQAAHILFAFAKIHFVPGAETFHLHRLLDIPQAKNTFGLIDRNGTKKLAYEVFRKIAPDASNVVDLINGEYHNIWMEFVGVDLSKKSDAEVQKYFVRKVRFDPQKCLSDCAC